MGNRNSTSIGSSSQPQIISKEEPLDESITTVTSSGVFLSNQLQADIVQSFQSEALQTQWEKLQAKILTNHRERITQDEIRKAQVQEEIQKWRKHNDAVHASLDQKLDELRAKFTDAKVAITYDVEKLEGKLGKVPKFGGTDGACLDVRMAVSNCFKGEKDVRQCDDVLGVLENCVKKTVTAS